MQGEGIDAYNPERHRKHALQCDADPDVTLHSYASWALHAIGLLDQASRQNDRALALADASSNPYSLVEAMTFRAQLAFMRRDPEEALRFAEAALRMSKEHHCPVYAALSRVRRGWAFALQGDGVRGVAEMSEGLAAAAEVGMLNEFAFARPTMLGEALAKLGQVPQALTVVDQAIDFIARTNSRACEAEA